MSSSSINELYFRMLVSKNALSVLQTYYTNIKDKILSDLNDLLTSLSSLSSWIENTSTTISTLNSEANTNANNFYQLALNNNSSITDHEAYKLLKAEYEKHVEDFYNRIHIYENSNTSDSYTVENFIKHDISSVSSEWKFHYSTNFQDALPIEKTYGALNITSNSDIIEFSNNRYIYITDENLICDVDYNTKDVYLSTLDVSTSDFDALNISNVKDIYSGSFKIYSLISIEELQKIFIAIDTGKSEINTNYSISSSRTSNIIDDGNPSESTEYERFVFGIYDENSHSIKILNGNNIYIDKLFINEKIKITKVKSYKEPRVQEVSDSGNFWFFIKKSFFCINFDLSNSYYLYTMTSKFTVPMGNNNPPRDAVIYGNHIVTHSRSTLTMYIIPLTQSADEVDGELYQNSISNDSLLSILSNNSTQTGVSRLFTVGDTDNAGLYIFTNNCLLYVDIEGYLRGESSPNLDSRSDKFLSYDFDTYHDKFTVDEYGYIYRLTPDNKNIYCESFKPGVVRRFAETDEDFQQIQKPTKYADKLINFLTIKNDTNIDYAYNKSPSLTLREGINETSGEAFIKTFIHDDKLVCITGTGGFKVFDLVTNEWISSSHVSMGLLNSSIKSIFLDDSTQGKLYVAYRQYGQSSDSIRIYGRDYFTGNEGTYTQIDNIGLRGNITALYYQNSKNYLYIGDSEGYVSVYDITNSRLHTRDSTNAYFESSDRTKYPIGEPKDSIGAEDVKGITSDGINLVVLGDFGRVGSCSLADFTWTSYNTTDNDLKNKTSKIFYNGKYVTSQGVETNINVALTNFFNYNNTKLVAMYENGYIMSCNLITGIWTTPSGKIVLHGGSGMAPGIYNEGTIFGGGNPKCSIRIGSFLILAGTSGKLASINLINGISTSSNSKDSSFGQLNTSYGDDTSGPGYYYGGEEFGESNDINDMVSNGSGIIYLVGTNAYVLAYAMEIKDVLIPTSNKICYIARRETKYDYLSSVMVRVTKGSLTERNVLYPPSEESKGNDRLIYNNNQHIFTNGSHAWKINSDIKLDAINYALSNDGGTFFEKVAQVVDNVGIPNNSITSNMVKGAVSENGNLCALFNFEGQNNFTYVLLGDFETKEVKWKAISRLSQDEIDTLECEGNNFFIIKTLNSYNQLSYGNDSKTVKFVNTQIEDITSGTIADTEDMFVSYNKELNTLFRIKVQNDSTKLYWESNGEEAYYQNFIEDMLSNIAISEVLSIRNLDVEIHKFFVSKHNVFNFVVSVNSNIRTTTYLVSIQINSDLLSIRGEFNKGNIEYDDSIVNVSSVLLFSHSYKQNISCVVNDNGTKAFVVCNYIKKNRSSEISTINLDYPSHDITYIELNLFGNYIKHNFRIIEEGESYVRIHNYNKTNFDMNAAYFSDLNESSKLINHTNKIVKFRVKDSIENTPIRALTDAWKELFISTENYNAVLSINLKLKNTSNTVKSDMDAISEQTALRYQVLITNLTDPSFILYEIEKSYGMCRTDDETKTVEPFFRVLACDRFRGSIYESFGYKGSKATYSNRSLNHNENSRDTLYSGQEVFSTGISLNSSSQYSVKIKQVNTVSDNIDASFFVNVLELVSSEDKINIVDNTNNTEFKDIRCKISDFINSGIQNIESSVINDDSNYNKFLPPETFNESRTPQIIDDISRDNKDINNYASIIIGNGDGSFDKANFVINYRRTSKNLQKLYMISILSVNKKDIKYTFDVESSIKINSNEAIDKDSVTAGRGIHKMHNFSVFTKSLMNNPDFYVDYDKGKIVNVEGTFRNRQGLFESISTIDGNQKRIKQVTENEDFETGMTKTVISGYDKITSRKYGFAYDVVDRFNTFEEPYKNIKAWWSSDSSKVKGNERLLSLSKSDSYGKGNIGVKHYPEENLIENVSTPTSNNEENTNDVVSSGITSATYGGINLGEGRSVAITELVDEKFPLEKWAGFEWADLCFIRKYRITYTDSSIEYMWEIEFPLEENKHSNKYTRNGNSAGLINNKFIRLNKIPTDSNEIDRYRAYIKPSIPRHLFRYNDTLSIEGEGHQTFEFLTVFYYYSHTWTVMKYETRDVNHTYSPSYDLTSDPYRSLNNITRKTGVTISDEIKFYVTNTNNVYSIDNQNSLLNHNDEKYNTASYGEIGFIEQNNGFGNTILNDTDAPNRWHDAYHTYDAPSINDDTIAIVPTLIDIPLTEVLLETNSDSGYRPLTPDDTYQPIETPSSVKLWKRGKEITNSKASPSGSYISVAVKIADKASPNALSDVDFIDLIDAGETVETAKKCEGSVVSESAKTNINPDSNEITYYNSNVDKSHLANIRPDKPQSELGILENTFGYGYGLRDIRIAQKVNGVWKYTNNPGDKTLSVKYVIYGAYKDENDSERNESWWKNKLAEQNSNLANLNIYDITENMPSDIKTIWNGSRTDDIKTKYIELKDTVNKSIGINATNILIGDRNKDIYVSMVHDSNKTLQGYFGKGSYKYIYSTNYKLTIGYMKMYNRSTQVNFKMPDISIGYTDAITFQTQDQDYNALIDNLNNYIKVNTSNIWWMGLTRDINNIGSHHMALVNTNKIYDKAYLRQNINDTSLIDNPYTDSDLPSASHFYITGNKVLQDYHFLNFTGNGINHSTETVKPKHMWITFTDIADNTSNVETDEGKTFVPNTIDASNESDPEGWKFTGKIHYEWNDGSIHTYDFNLVSLEKLMKLKPTSDGNTLIQSYTKTFSEEIDVDRNMIIKTYTINLVGYGMDEGMTKYEMGVNSNNSVTLTYKKAVEYTSDIDDTTGVSSQTAVWRWDSSGSPYETGVQNPEIANATFNVTFSVANCTSNGESTVQGYIPYTCIITPTAGNSLPNTITVTIGGTIMDNSNYSYTPSTGEVIIYGRVINSDISISS